MSAQAFPIHSFLSKLPSTVGIDADLLQQLAISSGFLVRKPRKITAQALFAALCECSFRGVTSYNDLACALQSLVCNLPSKQAVAKKMNHSWLDLCSRLLSLALRHKISANLTPDASSLLSGYHRVLVQDSTIIKLPAWLFGSFSGVSNAHSTVCNARIQAVHDLLAMQCTEYSLDSYSRNDSAAAPDLELQQGDLVLRDRGYLSVGEINRHIRAGADCIYRHKSTAVYLDPVTRQPIDMLRLLRMKGTLNITVCLNTPEATEVRLVAAPVDPQTADLRRMKAKKQTNGHAPSALVLALMDWTIFITTIPAAKADFRAILGIYGLRWRIEIIFKTWKSHLNFAAVHRVSETQLRILMTVRLFVITVLTNVLYKSSYHQVRKHSGRHLSLMKFTNFLVKSTGMISTVCLAIQQPEQSAELWETLRKYCCYDKRKRENYAQALERMLLS